VRWINAYFHMLLLAKESYPMKRISLGLVLAAIFAIGATASASAQPLFHSTTMGKLTAKALQTQKFHTAAGNVECSGLHLTGGEVGALLSLYQEVTVVYSGCKAFGLAATVHPVLYLFDASNLATVLSTVLILAAECTVTVPSAKNANLSTVVYKNSGKEVVLEPSVKNITSVGVGKACTYAEESVGTYTGNSSVGVENGGTLSWG
jgi:hypothetical protein